MAIESDELISKIRDALKPELTQISFDTWILPLGIRSIDGNHIVFTAVSEYQQDFIENKYRTLIFNTLKYITNREWTFSVINLEKEGKNDSKVISINDYKKDSEANSGQLEMNQEIHIIHYSFMAVLV